MEKIKLTLIDNNKKEIIEVEKNKFIQLPKPKNSQQTFLGYNTYSKLNYGFMSTILPIDQTLYAIYTNNPAYIIESYYLGDKDDYFSLRCQFRRYVVDIYLVNANASNGILKLNNCNNFLYFLGDIPVENVSTNISHDTNYRGDAYNDMAYFTTNEVTVKWESKEQIKAKTNKVKIARLMFAFSSWGMGYNRIENTATDDIIRPEYHFESMAGEDKALVSANFYNGIKSITPFDKIEDDKNVCITYTDKDVSTEDLGELLSRFGVLSDSHVGVRYNWENYNWLYAVYENLAKIHNKKPLDFILELGDNIDDGYKNTYQTDYKEYLEVVKKLDICDSQNPLNPQGNKILHYEMQGNHDTSLDTRFFRNKLWYSQNKNGKKVAFIGFFVDYGGYPAVNFNIANNYDSYRSYGVISNETVEFIEKSIIEAKKNEAIHIVLCSHFGIAQDLIAPVLPETGLGKIENLCKKHNIKLYLSGHEHNIPYTLRKYNSIYNYDASMTRDNYAVYEIYEKGIVVKIIQSNSQKTVRTDIIKL